MLPHVRRAAARRISTSGFSAERVGPPHACGRRCQCATAPAGRVVKMPLAQIAQTWRRAEAGPAPCSPRFGRASPPSGARQLRQAARRSIGLGSTRIHSLVGWTRTRVPPLPPRPLHTRKADITVSGREKMTPALPPKSLLNAFERLVIFRRQGGVRNEERSPTCLFETSRPRTSLPCPRPTCGARLCSRSSWARREGRHWMLGQRGHSPRPGAMQMLAWKG